MCPTLDKPPTHISQLFNAIWCYILFLSHFFPIHFASVIVTVPNNKTTDVPVILPTLNDLYFIMCDPYVSPQVYKFQILFLMQGIL